VALRIGVVEGLLAVMVLAAWLGCAGFARLRTPFDRIHCVAFVNATSGTALVLAAFLSDGASDRAWKILLVVGVNLLAGAAMSHAVGRALLLRGSRRKTGP
jgi:multicomponent Na+:H+ antiporter subunit G